MVSTCSSLAGPHLEQPLLLEQHAFLQAPEVQVGLAAGHDHAAVRRVKVHAKHRLIGALKAEEGAGLLVPVHMHYFLK